MTLGIEPSTDRIEKLLERLNDADFVAPVMTTLTADERRLVCKAAREYIADGCLNSAEMRFYYDILEWECSTN